MSYAEHGSRIFLTGNFNPNPLLRYGNYVARKRSEGRLKLFDSCSDLRAWSPHALDNCRHFREIIEKRTPSGRIVPYDVLIEYLIVMGQTKLASVSRQLEKYKCLRLTPEQKKQLQDLDYSSDVHVETSATSLSQESRIVEDDTGIPKRPGTPTQSICSSSSNFQDIEIDNNSSTDENSDDSREAFVSSVTYLDTTDLSHERSSQELRSGNRSSRTYEKDNHQKVIIKKDSEIISLNHELAAKEAELGETRELCQNLETALNEKIHTLDNMRKNLKISQEQLVGMSDQVHEQIEEWKKKFYESKRLVDHLKGTLAEKSQQCASYREEIESLRAHLQATEKRNLEELRTVLCQKNDLMKLNKKQAINLADQEDEINRLLAYINQNQAKQNEQEMRMKSELQHLRSKIEAKSSVQSQLETHQVTVRTEISPTGSLSRVQTSEIIKLKKALQDDFRAVEEELSRREGRKDDYYQDEEVVLWPKQTRDRTKDEPAERENCQSHKYLEISKALKECTIEQLPMQVSATKMASEGKISSEEQVCTDLENAKETIRRLVVQLEPYVEERQTLHDEIKCLKESFENVQRDSRARDLKMQQQLSSEVKNNRKRCDEDTIKIAQLENLLKEKNGRGDNEEVDKEIDKVLAIHVKRSIQRMTKLSAGLKGAGDDIAKIRDEVDIRECEIAKLKDQVKFHVSRGQGDEANNENLKAIVKLKSEKKRLIDELKNNEESLKKIKDELQSRDFELRGWKQAKNKLSAQYKRDIQSIQKYIDSIKKEKDTLARENESLSTSVAMIGDLVNHSDSMKTKLDALQEENAKLTEENTSMIKRCEGYENRLVDLANKEMQAKALSDRAEFKLQQNSAKNEIELEKLREENERLMNESNAAKTKITKLTIELERLRETEKTYNRMDKVWVEISKLNEDKEALDARVTRLRSSLETHHRTNEKLDNDLKWQISDNETWQLEINKLKDDIAKIEKEKPFDAAEKNLLEILPRKMSENLEKLRAKLNAKRSFERVPWQEEMEEMRAKSLEDEELIGKLRDEIQSRKKKITEQEERINALEVANTNLSQKLEDEKNSREYESQSTGLVNEIRKKEQQIERLTQELEANNVELRNLKEKIESLIKEKNDISNELKIEQEERGNSLKEVQQKHNARIKVLQASHEESMKNFIAQQDELMKNNGNAFDSESWLKSLTSKEWAELHKRISALHPCETLVDPATKTRALNDKQNQELQLKEKLHTDTFNRKNEHHKESSIGLRYSYERRKFDNTKHKAVETSFDDNNLMTRKRKIFIQECAEKHKYDVGH